MSNATIIRFPLERVRRNIRPMGIGALGALAGFALAWWLIRGRRPQKLPAQKLPVEPPRH